MARELPDYRNTIEQLNRLFPEKELLTLEDVKKVTGYKSETTLKKYFPFINSRINKATLARCLSVLPKKGRREWSESI